MCSSGGAIAKADLAIQQSGLAIQQNLASDYNTTFKEQQGLLGNLQARLNYMASNPLGYSPQELHAATTSIVGNAATSAKQALGSAAAYAAAHGGADVGSGVAGEIAGQIGVSAANQKAQALSDLSVSNQQMKRQNMWNAISGLNSVGSELGGAGATAIGGANSAAETGVNAGSGALAAQQAGWQDLGGVLSGIGGLGMAASSFKNFNQGGGAAQPNLDSTSGIPEDVAPGVQYG